MPLQPFSRYDGSATLITGTGSRYHVRARLASTIDRPVVSAMGREDKVIDGLIFWDGRLYGIVPWDELLADLLVLKIGERTGTLVVRSIDHASQDRGEVTVVGSGPAPFE
jgi:hypothetical protein